METKQELINKYKKLEKEFTEYSRIDSLHKIVERKANQIVLMKRFLSDLEYMKGEN